MLVVFKFELFPLITANSKGGTAECATRLFHLIILMNAIQSHMLGFNKVNLG